MPTKNRIRVLLADNDTTAKELVESLPDVDRTSMSYIEQGRVLPTRATLKGMCDTLHCKPSDLYDPNDIDLAGTVKTPATVRINSGGHDDMERVYIWYPKGGKEALFEVIKQLDYPSVAEWFRDMARETFLKAAKLEGKTLHDAAKEDA